MTTDKDGTEVLMYDKTASTTSNNYSHSGSQASRSEASAMAGFSVSPWWQGSAVRKAQPTTSLHKSAKVLAPSPIR